MSKELKPEDIIPFIRSKDYKFIQNLGTGSFAKTVLIKDEIIDELYACKKYEPSIEIIDEDEKKRYFDKFIEEIKILNKIVHPNIVRIYNNYIYPNKKIGYIIMEYVENAKEISEYIKNNNEKLNNIFEQIINGFCYLEQNKLCHRDIRSKNILIDSSGIVKIIDFGFGKTYSIDENVSPLTLYKNNWIATPPSEMNTQDENTPIYNNKTEIYFVGQLIKQIIEENNIQDFKYDNILNDMIKYNMPNRIDSFTEIQKRMSKAEMKSKEIFTNADKNIYKRISNKLDEIIESVEYGTSVNEISSIIEKLEKTLIKYSLEEKILNNKDFAECFFGKIINVNESDFKWDSFENDSYEINSVYTDFILEIIEWLNRCNDKQREIIRQNLQAKLEHFKADFADLPF